MMNNKEINEELKNRAKAYADVYIAFVQTADAVKSTKESILAAMPADNTGLRLAITHSFMEAAIEQRLPKEDELKKFDLEDKVLHYKAEWIREAMKFSVSDKPISEAYDDWHEALQKQASFIMTDLTPANAIPKEVTEDPRKKELLKYIKENELKMAICNFVETIIEDKRSEKYDKYEIIGMFEETFMAGQQMLNDIVPMEFCKQILTGLEKCETREDMLSFVRGTRTTIENKTELRTLEDYTRLEVLQEVLIALTDKASDVEEWIALSGMAILPMVHNIPKTAFFEITTLCQKYSENYTESGKTEFIEHLKGYVGTLLKGKDNKTMLKHSVLDAMKDGRAVIHIEEE